MYLLLKIIRITWFQQKLNNFVDLDFFFSPNFLGLILDSCEKRIKRLGGHAWRHFLWLVANLKQWPFTSDESEPSWLEP